MKKAVPCAFLLAVSSVYSAVCLFLSRVFIRNLASAARWIMRLVSSDQALTDKVPDVLRQLKDASLVSPVWLFLLFLASACILLHIFFLRKRRYAKAAVLFILLLIPASFAFALFTHVNDILLWDMIRLLVSVVSNL